MRPLDQKTRAENVSVTAQKFYQTALMRKVGGGQQPAGQMWPADCASK